jgi:hypothetical protein
MYNVISRPITKQWHSQILQKNQSEILKKKNPCNSEKRNQKQSEETVDVKKMADLIPTILIITLNVRDLISKNEKQRSVEWIKKHDSTTFICKNPNLNRML